MTSKDELTGKEIISLLYHATSLEIWELAEIALQKWDKKYSGTEKVGEIFLHSGTMIGLRESHLRENEAAGLDSAKMIAEQEDEINAWMKQWIYERPAEEADEIWQKWIEEEQEFHRYIEEAIRKARDFVSATD